MNLLVKLHITFCNLIITALLILSANLCCADQKDQSETLLGNIGETRNSLEEKGISVESILTHDFMANVSGGAKRNSAILGNYDLTLALDTAKAGLWEGGTTFIYFLGNYGNSIGELVGDTQGVSNIEAFGTFKVYEAWHDQKFGEDLAVLVGLHDYNSEFDALDYAGSLLNSSFGVGVDISQVGPSIFPTTALAARIRVNPTESSYILAAAYDGVPGNPYDRSGTQIVLKEEDGVFYAMELGVAGADSASADYYKLALGGWYHTAEFEDYAGNARDRNNGLYIIAEKSLWRESDSSRGMGAFLQLGFAPDSRNQIANYIGSGLSYSGLFPSRAEDVTCLGIAIARNGDDFMSSTEGIDRTESALELTHRFQILPYLSLQPDIQWIFNPGTESALDDAIVLGIRSEIAM